MTKTKEPEPANIEALTAERDYLRGQLAQTQHLVRAVLKQRENALNEAADAAATVALLQTQVSELINSN